MKTEVLIVGQGVSGTFLSWFLHQANIEFVVVDAYKPNTSSRVAAGIINPVTGRRVVKVWLDDIIIPFAEKTYNEIGKLLGINAIEKKPVIDFFPNPFMKESFLKKIAQKEDYISVNEDESFLKEYFHYEFGSGTIYPAYVAHLSNLIPAWRKFLQSRDRLSEEYMDIEALSITPEKIIYRNIEAKKIIFCEGADVIANRYFSLLPFALNKGEALIIEAQNLPADYIYKKSMMLAPLAHKNFFWVGTNYSWDFNDDQPSDQFRASTEQVLSNWLKVPYKIVEHRSAVRPATVERRPFSGFHPIHKNVGILNGMGTKGCSLAPYFAYRLCENILTNSSLEKEADINRFKRILESSGSNF